MESTEQNKTEEATQFKLKKAREKGSVARGVDLGFFSTIAALSMFLTASLQTMAGDLSLGMRNTFVAIAASARDLGQLQTIGGLMLAPASKHVALLGATVVVVVVLFEIVQLRGMVFTTHPLKPDFNRLNPAKGLKRVFSTRMLKETLKNIVKMVVYGGATYAVVHQAVDERALTLGDAGRLAEALREQGLQLLFTFVCLALAFAALDQVLARGDYRKQMRMGRGELDRENKEREGNPRLKQKRKQLHAEFASQTKGFGDLRGADLLVVNPDHFAIALCYDAATMSAPKVIAKGRNHFALMLKRRAAELSLPVFHAPVLARALYRQCSRGDETPPSLYKDVAGIYLNIARKQRKEVVASDA